MTTQRAPAPATGQHRHELRTLRTAGTRFEQVACLGCGRVWFSDTLDGELVPWDGYYEALFARIDQQKGQAAHAAQ